MKKQNENYEAISLYDDNGAMKSKEEFIADVAAFYDSVSNSKGDTECNCGGLIEALTEPDAIVDPMAVLENYDFLSRTIFLSEEITPEIGTEVVRKIRLWNTADKIDGIETDKRAPIKIYIDTPGGDIDAVLNIISAIQISTTPIYTITYGCGYSGGFFIGINGHKRYGFPNSSYLFHEGMAMDGGDAHKFLQHVDFYKMRLKKIKDITTSKTKISSEEYEAHKKDDWFFSPSEAIHYGIIDEILESF